MTRRLPGPRRDTSSGTITKFWDRVRRTDGPNDCWEWALSRDSDGYGRYVLDGKRRFVHHIAYESAHGPVPSGAIVLHSCDNPPRCNPEHLHPGTHKLNAEERSQRDRGARGERSPHAKLSDAAVARIRESDEDSETLAGRFGVHPMTIEKVRYRRTWRHLP